MRFVDDECVGPQAADFAQQRIGGADCARAEADGCIVGE
ncbi:hypothetical protein HDG38_005365 [Paraburkholderia sp. WSM4177]|nr:hypothetical protein [Paraburkholderia sp. WSM4177]